MHVNTYMVFTPLPKLTKDVRNPNITAMTLFASFVCKDIHVTRSNVCRSPTFPSGLGIKP